MRNMAKLTAAIFVIAGVLTASADIFRYEPFDYDPGTYTYLDDANSGNTPWNYGGVQSASMTNGNLAWPGYKAHGTGYKVHVINTEGFTYTTNGVGWNGTNGFRYDAVIVKLDDITNLKTTWDLYTNQWGQVEITNTSYREHCLLGGCTYFNRRGDILVKKDSNDTSRINFGVVDYKNWSNYPTWDTNSYAGTEAHLLVMRFSPNPPNTGGSPQPLMLYVDPDVTDDEPATPNISAHYRGLEATRFNMFGNADINFEVDEWTSASTWRELFPLPKGTLISIK